MSYNRPFRLGLEFFQSGMVMFLSALTVSVAWKQGKDFNCSLSW
jgi:hypothetical protein